MRCSEAQARINSRHMVTESTEFDQAVREHIEGCPQCSKLERARHLIGHDFQELAAEAQQESMSFQKLQEHSLAQHKLREKTANPNNSKSGVAMFIRHRLAAVVMVVAVFVLIVAQLLSRNDDHNGHDIMFAGVDETLLLSGAIDQLFEAVGLLDAVIEEAGCDPQCTFRVTGLHSLTDKKLAVAALQAVPDAIIITPNTYTDQRTGREVTRSESTRKMTISDNQWILELGIDSSLYKRISLALDSLKQDTTISWTKWFRHGEKDVPLQEECVVHPDGSYSKSIFAHPEAYLGWSKQTWTFDSTGSLIGQTLIDTQGVSHEIDNDNWMVREQQMSQFGMYSMITYDEEGIPHNTGTNFDPAGVSGYEPNLPPGMFINQNTPNPFDSITQITFGIPEKAHVQLTIYNMFSQLVCTLTDSTMTAGTHTITWMSRSDWGKLVRSPIYMCKLQVGEHYRTIKMYQVW